MLMVRSTPMIASNSAVDAWVVFSDVHIVASTLKPFISMSLYKNIHGFDVDATICKLSANDD